MLTDGFSGADLAELCQRAAKAAIRDAIAADELKTDDMDVDAANEICRKHFEELLWTEFILQIFIYLFWGIFEVILIKYSGFWSK